MKATLARLGQAFDRIEDAMALIAAILLILVMVLVSVAVTARYLFNNPMAWVLEITEYMLLYLAFLAAPWLLRHDEHVRIDLVTSRVSPGARALLHAWGSVLSAAGGFALVWYGTLATLEQYQRGVVMLKILEVPKFVLLTIIPIGLFILSIEFVRRLFCFMAEYRSASPEAEAPCEKSPTEMVYF